ncbi:MAG: CocE/NonD family hydrolase C-terminal non-catalytic domain-containing protein [Planctomycetota bacterium]
MHHVLRHAFLPLFALAPLAAQDPPPPVGGFPVVEVLDRTIAWSDTFRTRMDLYRPDVAPPATGWPGVLAVHGGAENRKTALIRSLARYLAGRGYVVYAYDVSGDGDTIALNPGFPPRGEDRVLLDAAESHGVAQGLLAGFIDPTRLAVTGNSQGGKHSLDAAAYSGRQLPLAGWVSHYPLVAAVAPEIASLDPMATSLPGGVLVSDELTNGRAPTDPLVVMLDAEDYAGIVAWAQAQLTTRLPGLLAGSNVPMLVMLAWHDLKHAPTASAGFLGTLPMAKRLFLTTGGHGTPMNSIERGLEQELRGRWFDRFLKGTRNGVEAETYAEVAVTPDNARYLDTGSVWEHRRFAQWPPAFARTHLYLRGAGTLSSNPPPAIEVGPQVRHRVQPGFSPADYVALGGGRAPAQVYARIPRLEFAFESAPLSDTYEIAGRSSVELHVDDSTGTFQLSAELSHLDPAGNPTYITSGTGGVRGGAAGRHLLRFDLRDVAHVVPAGHRLRLAIVNLATHRPPGQHRIHFVPYFTATDTTLMLRPGAASRVLLPLRPYVANLKPRLAQASAAAGIDHAMLLDGGAARAGLAYVTVMGASGEAPGFLLPGLTSPVPVNLDVWSQVGFALLGTAFAPDFVGVLDAQGQATPGLRVPPLPAAALLGQRVTFGGVVLSAAGGFDTTFGPAVLSVGL